MKKIVLITIVILGLLSATSSRAYALPGDPDSCIPPFGIPAVCQDNYEPDTGCSIAKILNPEVNCCVNSCKGIPDDYNPCPNGGSGADCEVRNTLSTLNIFGTKIQYTPEKVPALIQLAISAALAVVSFYALFRGMFLYAIKRPNTTDAAEVAKINKEFGNIIIGFVLAWSVIFIVEFVMRLLGLPSLSQINVNTLDDPANPGTNVIIIQ